MKVSAAVFAHSSYLCRTFGRHKHKWSEHFAESHYFLPSFLEWAPVQLVCRNSSILLFEFQKKKAGMSILPRHRTRFIPNFVANVFSVFLLPLELDSNTVMKIVSKNNDCFSIHTWDSSNYRCDYGLALQLLIDFFASGAENLSGVMSGITMESHLSRSNNLAWLPSLWTRQPFESYAPTCMVSTRSRAIPISGLLCANINILQTSTQNQPSKRSLFRAQIRCGNDMDTEVFRNETGEKMHAIVQSCSWFSGFSWKTQFSHSSFGIPVVRTTTILG